MKVKAIHFFFWLFRMERKKFCHISKFQRVKKHREKRIVCVKSEKIKLGVKWMMTVKKKTYCWNKTNMKNSGQTMQYLDLSEKSDENLYWHFIAVVSPMQWMRINFYHIFIQHEKKNDVWIYNNECICVFKKKKCNQLAWSLQCGHGYYIFRLLCPLYLFSHCIDKMLTT